jgi:hypothetical protein
MIRIALGGNMPKADQVGDAWFEPEDLSEVFMDFAHLEPFRDWRGKMVGTSRQLAKQRIAKAIGRWLAERAEDPPAGLALRPKEIALVLELAANSADAREIPLAALPTLESPNGETYSLKEETARSLRRNACKKLASFLLEPNLANGPISSRGSQTREIGLMDNLVRLGEADSYDRVGETLELSTLPLESGRLSPPPGIQLSPYHLLWPRFGVVPFDDRAGWLSDLETWCAASSGAEAAVIVGPGGMGKTRLALELCDSMARQGWVVGFYREAGPDALRRLAAVKRPRLVVIDYADADPDMALKVLAALGDPRTPFGERVRVVLLVRRGDVSHLFGRRQSQASLLVENAMRIAVGQGSQSASHQASGTSFALDSRLRLYEAAVRAFGAEGSDAPDLTAEVYATPLFVLFAAVLAAQATRSAFDIGTTRESLLERVLDREEAIHWATSPESLPAATRRAVAITTLLGAESEVELAAHLRAAEPWHADGDGAVRVALWAHELYDGYLWANPVEPDLLGERLVASSLPPLYLGAVLDLPASRALSRALTVMARIASDDPGWADLIRAELVPRLQTLVAMALAHEQELDVNRHPVAAALTALLEVTDIGEFAVLAELPRPLGGRGAILAEVLARKFAQWCRERSAGSDPDEMLVESLHNWAVRLSDVGLLSEALDASREALDAALKAGIPRTNSRLHAAILHRFSNSLADLNELPKALDASRDALAIRQELGSVSVDDAVSAAHSWIAYGDRLSGSGGTRKRSLPEGRG